MANKQYTVEDIAKIRKGMTEARQKRSEEIAKQTNAAPKYNTLPTLNDMSKRVPNQAPSSVSLGDKTFKLADNAKKTSIDSGKKYVNSKKDEQTGYYNKQIEKRSNLKKNESSLSPYGWEGTLKSVRNKQIDKTNKELASTYINDRTNKKEVNDAVDKWLNPEYKMTEFERKQAKELTDDYFRNYNKATGGATKELKGNEKKEYDRMNELAVKANKMSAAIMGSADALGAVTAGKAINKAIDKDTANDINQLIDKEQDVAKMQSPLAYNAGYMGTKMGEYATLNKLLDSVPALTKLGQTLNSFGGLTKDMFADLLLDTSFETAENAVNGEPMSKMGADMAMNIGTNALFNLAPNVLGDVLKNANPNMVDDVAKNLGEAIEKEAKEVPKIENPKAPETQNGIQVYRGYNRSDNPLERNLAKEKTLSAVLGKKLPSEEDPEMLPLEFYTESLEDATNYANHDKMFYDSLRKNAIHEIDADGYYKMDKIPKEEQEAWIKAEMDESYRILTGREPVFDGGHVDTHIINPKNTLDMTELGDVTNVDSVYNFLSRELGIPQTAFEGKNVDSYFNGVFPDYENDFNTYMLLKNGTGTNADWGSRFLNLMRDNGYDSVKYTEDGYNHYALLNDANNQATKEIPNVAKPEVNVPKFPKNIKDDYGDFQKDFDEISADFYSNGRFLMDSYPNVIRFTEALDGFRKNPTPDSFKKLKSEYSEFADYHGNGAHLKTDAERNFGKALDELNARYNIYSIDNEIDDYLARRETLIERMDNANSPRVSMNYAKDIWNLDDDMMARHPELFDNGEFIGKQTRYMAEDIGLRGDEGGIKEEFSWETPEEPPRVEVNGEAPSEVQPELLNKMDDRYRTNEYVMKNKSSKTVSNADRRIDTEYADELMEKGIDRYWSQSHKQQYSDAREAVSSDYDGNLNKYLNNDGSMYTGTDYNAIRILEEDIKAKRKGAIAEGNEELANKYTEQLEKLATTRRLRATSSGQFNEAAKAWISTAEGAIDTAINKVNDAIDNLPKNEAKFITEAADDIYDNANKMLEGEDLWNELERGEKKDKIASEIAKKIKDISKEKNIKVNDELANKIANDIINGADSDTIAREIAAFHEYGFLGIDDNVLDEVTDIFDRAEQLPYGSKERVELEQGAYSKLAREIYKNGGDKMDIWNAWRYFSMLSSSLTDIRNVLSTGTFSEIEHRTSNAIAYALEAGMDNAVKGLKEGSNFFFNTDYDTSKGIKRTKAFINPASEADQTLLKKSWDDATEGSYRWLVGHKFNPSLNSGIESEKPVFKPNSKADKTLGKVFKKRGDVLTGEDFFFKRNKFATSLAGYLKANGADASIFDNAKRFEELNNKMGLLTNEERAEMEALRPDFNLMSEARDYAVKEAQYSTYNTPNNAGKVSEASKRMLQSSNPITRYFGRWIEGLLAFKQTPANILRTMYDYSPLSVGSSAKKLVQAGASSDNTKVGKVLGKKVGESTWADAFSQLSKTLTGTGLVWLGAALYDDGIITPSSDDVTGKSDETEGKQEYSININGKSYKLDWLGPAVSSLLLGAEAKKTYDKYHDEDDTFWDVTNKVWNGGIDEILDTAMTIFDPAIEMSMLKGFSDTIDNVRYQDSKASGAMALLASPILSYYGQAVPQLLGGITRTADNTRRSLRTNNEGVGGIIERSARQVASKIPFLNQKNMEYVDMWGEGQKNYDGNLAQRAAYQFLAPSYVKELKSEPYQDELDRLYDVTGDAEVLNSSFPNKIDGERLTNDEYHDAQEIAGKTLQSFINATLESDEYKSLDPAVQADVQERLQKAANAVGTHLVRPEKKMTDDVYNAYGQDKNVQAALDEAIKGAKRTSINTAISDMGLQANDVTKALYQNNDTQGLEKYKDATNIGKEYGFDNITSTQWKVYKSKGEKALRKELEYAQEAGEYGVKNSKAFKELVDRGASGEQIKEAYDAITSVQVGKDEYGDPKYMPFTRENFELYRKYGERGIKDYAYIESKGADFDTYLQARKVIPDMSKQEYVKKFKAIDGSAGSKPDGDISQKELLQLFNSKNFNQSQVNKYWNAFGQVSGDDAWKKVPVLKYNKKTGKNEWKTQKK